MKSQFRDLTPYKPSHEFPWDRNRVGHLLRRTRIGDPSPQEIDRFLNLGPDRAVDVLFEFPQLPEPFEWVNEPPGAPENPEIDQERREELIDFMIDLALKDVSIRERLVYFWSNHFVVQVSKVKDPRWMFRINNLFRKNATGNIRELTKAVGKEPAMLKYLDGIKNTKRQINENYARELQELFTIGRGNYTQNDVVEAARAFTGWKINNKTGKSYFVPWLFDAGEKTFYGYTGNFNGDDIVDIIFQRPETATFLAKKIYRHFVSYKEDEEVISQLATLLVNNDFELAPVLKTLFKSAHFMDDIFIGADIKSPQQLLIGLLRQFSGKPPNSKLTRRLLSITGQPILEPPNVSGWKEHEAWLDTSTLIYRKALSINFIERHKKFGLDINGFTYYYAKRASTTKELFKNIITDLLPTRLSNEDLENILNFFDIDRDPYINNATSTKIKGKVLGLLETLVQMEAFQLT